MKYELKNETMTVYFVGELNSYNADEIEKQVLNILENNAGFKVLNLDFADLSYVSSAGLRIILKFKQKYGDVHVINASLEVYDVLQMTGFTNIMDVKKALIRVSVDGAKVIGEGFFSTVYRINKDTIIKVFNRVSDPDQIQRELDLAKQAFVLGIPTAISFDIVKVEDKLGVRFEMLDCASLKDVFLSHKEQYNELIDKYVELLKKINTTECINPEIRDCKLFFKEKVETIQEELGVKYYKKALALLDTIPNEMTFVHGDCHFKNIMVQGDDLLIIDMDTLTRGHFIFELALLRAPYVAFEEDDPGNTEKFLGVSKELCSNIYNDTLNKYLGKDDEVIKEKIALLCYIHMIWWNKVNTPDFKPRLEGCRSRLFALMDKYNDLLIK